MKVNITNKQKLSLLASLKDDKFYLEAFKGLELADNPEYTFQEVLNGCNEDTKNDPIYIPLTKELKAASIDALRTGFLDFGYITQTIKELRESQPFLDLMKAASIADENKEIKD